MNVLLESPTTVLVVGDDLDVDHARRTLLEGAASEVVGLESVADLEAALVERDGVGCVVTGWSLPDGHGIDVCEVVAARAPAVSIVFWTAETTAEDVRAAVNAGADGYVGTDEPDAALRERVDEVLETTRHRLENAERSEVLETILEDSRVPMYIKDAEGRHLLMSDVPSGMNPETVVGKTDLEIYDDDPEFARDAYEDDMAVVEDGRGVYEKDEEYYNEGDVYWSRTNKFPWRDDDGGVKGLVGISVPITDLKRSERRLEEMHDRFEKFASFLTHDLQTPLQVASGALELARETGDPEAFDRLENGLGRLEDMIDDLGVIAREQRPVGGVTTTTRIGRVVDQVWDVVGRPSAEVVLAFDDDAYVDATSRQLRPLLENLLKNAIEHGGEDVTVEIGPTDWAGFYVADDGPGISEDERDRVFEPGYTTGEDGDGTGLEIVAEIAEQNGWQLSVEESASGGARFVVSGCLLVPDPAPDRTPGEPRSLDAAADVGEVEVGEASYDRDADRWTVRADGEDIWNEENDFHYVHAAVEGPVRIEGRLVDVTEVNPYSKAALMVRDGLDEDAAYGAVGITPAHGSELLWRREAGAKGESHQLGESQDEFAWYRVERDGDVVTLSLSRDGNSWRAVDQRRVDLADPVHVGLAATSGIPGQPAEAVFEDVSVHWLE